MSLVNQMLTQLEDQRGDVSPDDLPLLVGLSPATIQPEPLMNRQHIIALVVLCVIGAISTMIYRGKSASELTTLYRNIPIQTAANSEGDYPQPLLESLDTQEATQPVSKFTPIATVDTVAPTIQGIAMDETLEGLDIDIFVSSHIPYSLYAADDHIGLQLPDTKIDADLINTLSLAGAISNLTFAHEDNGELVLMFTLSNHMVIRSAEMLQESDTVRLNIQLSNVLNRYSVAESTLAEQPESVAQSKPKGQETMAKMSDNESSNKSPLKLGSFQKSPVTVPPEQQASAYYKDALKLLYNGNKTLALDHLHQTLRLDPKHTAARGLLANRLLLRKDILRAEGLLTEGLKLQPKAFELAKMLARVYLEKGQGQQAIKVMSRALPEITEAPDYHAFLATLHQREGDHDEAIQGFRKVLSIEPGNGKWSTSLGISLMAKGETSSATQAFQQAALDETLSVEIKRFVADKIAVLQG